MTAYRALVREPERKDRLRKEGVPLSQAEKDQLEEHAEAIIGRCEYLYDDFNRAKDNIRKYDKTQVGAGAGGWAANGGDWMALSIQRIEEDFEMVLTHELLHLDGNSHGRESGTEEWEAFKAKEEECSGGRTSLW